MPARIRVRVAIAALLIAIAIAGPRALGPEPHWTWPASGVALVGGLLEAVLAALFCVLHWRRAAAGPNRIPELPAKLRRLLSGALVACLIAIPLLLAVGPLQARTGQLPKVRPERLGRSRRHLIPPVKHGTGQDLGPLLRDLLIVILIAAVIVIAVTAWRRRRHGRRLWATDDLLTVVAPDDDELAKAVHSGLDALRQYDDARLAIIACYLAMEASLARGRR